MGLCRGLWIVCYYCFEVEFEDEIWFVRFFYLVFFMCVFGGGIINIFRGRI